MNKEQKIISEFKKLIKKHNLKIEYDRDIGWHLCDKENGLENIILLKQLKK